MTRHGMSNSRVYKIWQQMKVRCDNPKSIKYNIYGGKGISYPTKWATFEGFWNDMELGYADSLTLDRINGNEPYSKENCRWVSYAEQNMNKINNVKHNAKKLIKATGLSQSTVYRRLRNGWSIDKIADTPKLTNNGREGATL